MGFHESCRYKAVFQALICLLLVGQVGVQEYPILPTDQPRSPGPELIFPYMEKASLTIAIWFANATGNGNSTIEKLTIDEYLNQTERA